MDYARPEVSIIESESNSVNNSGDARRLRLSTTQAKDPKGLIDGSSMAMKKWTAHGFCLSCERATVLFLILIVN
jgi:hypothetical protein